MVMSMAVQMLVNGLSLGAVYALIAVGYALVYSVMKFSNFAYGGMVSVCAYAAFYFQSAMGSPPIIVTVLFSMLAGGALAIILDFTTFRKLRGRGSPSVYYFISSITFGMVLEKMIIVFLSPNYKMFPTIFENTTFTVLGTVFSTMDVTIFFICIGILAVLMFVIEKTRLGLAVRCVAQDLNTSKLMGINPNVIVLAWVIAMGFLAGVCGVLLGIKYAVYPSLGPSLIIKGWIASVLGGLGSLNGAIGAAFLMGLLEMLLVYFFGAIITPVFIFVILLVFLFVRPQGISGIIVAEKA